MFCCSRFYVRDGALVGDFRDSLQPMIWRMELTRVHAVGFRVQPNGPNWDLGMEGTAGNFSTIASFSTEAAANKALNGIGCGLRHQGWVRRAIHSIALVVLAMLVIMLVYSVGGSMVNGAGRMMQSSSAVSAPQPQVQIPLGQSMSADQALRAPPPQAH